jgi:hypothetical protein
LKEVEATRLKDRRRPADHPVRLGGLWLFIGWLLAGLLRRRHRSQTSAGVRNSICEIRHRPHSLSADF